MEKASDKGYNEAIIAATREMRTLKDVICQAGIDHGLEKAQIPISYELFRLSMSCPSEVFRASAETTDMTKVTATRKVEDQGQQLLGLAFSFFPFVTFVINGCEHPILRHSQESNFSENASALAPSSKLTRLLRNARKIIHASSRSIREFTTA